MDTVLCMDTVRYIPGQLFWLTRCLLPLLFLLLHLFFLFLLLLLLLLRRAMTRSLAEPWLC